MLIVSIYTSTTCRVRLGWLLLAVVLPALCGGQQPPPPVFINAVPTEGLLLNQGWRFHPGNLPNGADPCLDDSRWAPIDPTRNMAILSQLQRAGIGWLRLHLTTGDTLPVVMAFIHQSVASELYLDGKLLYRFGTVNNHPDSTRAYNPSAGYGLPLRSHTSHLLSIRFACQSGLSFNKRYRQWQAPAVQVRLFPATSLPALRPLTLQSAWADAIKVGIAFILFILHLSLFAAYPKQSANLFAAAMYALLCLTFLSRAFLDVVHSPGTQLVLYYGSHIDGWVPIVALITLYSLFDLSRGLVFWLVIVCFTLRMSPLTADWQTMNQVIAYLLPLEFVRVSLLATQRRQLGARTVLIGTLCNLGIWIIFTLTSVFGVPSFFNSEWFYHSLYLAAFLCIPLTLSLRLALEHGWTNRQLSLKLVEVEDLSARNLAQQQEREQLLGHQNEQLEQQVAQRTQELRRQAERLTELSQARARFVTNLTHEFRTPLSLIISPVEKLLESDNLAPAVQAPLRTIDRNARHLLSQVNQLLDIARLEDGQMRVNRQPVRLDQLTAQLVDLFDSSAQAKQLRLAFESTVEPTEFWVDTDKWDKIVYNLLANALKFTPVGGQITVNLAREESEVRLAVSDTGIGISPGQLPYIFDRFYQTDEGLTRPYEGTGVGLALVRELTDLMGGTVRVASQPGEGSTFTVTLPIQPPAPDEYVPTQPVERPVFVLPTASLPDRAADEQPLTDEENERPLVLVVEDNAELRTFMVDELATRYRVITAGDGQEGWAGTLERLPDIVISDVMMPRMDGFELTRLIKSTPATDHIAVVLLTARSDHESRLTGLEQGADEYITKPFELAELRLRLGNLLLRQQRLLGYYRQQIAPFNGHLPHPLPPRPDAFLERVYALLERHLDNPRVSVEWLADELSMDRKTLYRKIQTKLHLSPNALIRIYRLRRAGELLRTGKTVTETSYSVGFGSVTYFGQCFKEQYGLTPSEFVNQFAG